MRLFTISLLVALALPAIPTQAYAATTLPDYTCVQYVRYHLGLPLPRGDAIDLIPNGAPGVGGAVIYDYGNGVGHVAGIVSMNALGFVEKGANINDDGRPYERFVLWSNPNIVGYWRSTKL